MNPLVAPGVCRFSILGTYAGRNIANVLDVHIDITGTISDRNDAIADQAAIIVSAWADEICDLVANNYTATEVRWLDLNDEDGNVGSTSTGTGTDFPASGTDAGNAMPGNVAIRVNKQISASRGQRKGRLYLVGPSEDQTTDGAPNNLTSAFIGTVNTKFGAFKSAVEQSAGVIPPNYDSEIVVLHTHIDRTDPDNPVLVYEGRSPVTAFACDSTLGSQRRRLRG